ncbi:pilus assembly protein [Pelistega europaea]|uniref:Pilus assembly protein n=2 Tax=Pelistega europaea TaxID=106147 RepID=A0A7Y4L9Q6_9BURK|nr:pilus assembly protein [Pelistega europaea]
MNKDFISPLAHNIGMSSVGFIISAVPILLLGLGGIEMTQWYQTRHLVNVALVEAARQASVTHAHPLQIATAFEQALLPLFTAASSRTSNTSSFDDLSGHPHSHSSSMALSRQQKYFLQVLQQTQVPAWRIVVDNPKHSHFVDFHRDDLDIAHQTGLLAIDNNYQYEQHQRKGTGLLSLESIYEANTLSMKITYAYEPMLPGVKTLFRALQHFAHDDYAKQLFAQGFLPITQRLSISMQSHPVEWPSLGDGRVVMQWNSSPVSMHTNTSSMASSLSACSRGIWCRDNIQPKITLSPFKSSPDSRLSTFATASTPDTAFTSPLPPSAQHSSAEPLSNHSDNSANIVTEIHPSTKDEQNPLCGISLCCKGS